MCIYYMYIYTHAYTHICRSVYIHTHTSSQGLWCGYYVVITGVHRHLLPPVVSVYMLDIRCPVLCELPRGTSLYWSRHVER